jgi:hypothetical protein
VVTAPLWLALAVVVVLAHAVRQVALYLIVWFWWIGHDRRRTIFVYSDSPNWKEYIDRVILPRLPENSVVLNWSYRGQRQTTRHSTLSPPDSPDGSYFDT